MQEPIKNKKPVRNRHRESANGSKVRRDSGMNEEEVIDRLLQALPDVLVANNFTSQVVQLVQREGEGRASRRGSIWSEFIGAFSWARKIAVVSLIAVAAVFSHYQYQRVVRVEVARSVAAVGHLASLPTVDMLENFEVIRRLDVAPHQADMELLAALQ